MEYKWIFDQFGGWVGYMVRATRFGLVLSESKSDVLPLYDTLMFSLKKGRATQGYVCK